ncbi:hypothetical protein N1027_09625 [Herbiconiux sp. CPCC 205763]|uniref:DUF7144 domain-containing protein n=1 Tax=Herbiconiux aconitum TaxID=2970913 RepID=A0ABT2GU42_9MICO|nr:hypothetical protein [Herbiconiux aconitum]MCS5718396.1 hypothetical protein [Herbiconiux aconitum]
MTDVKVTGWVGWALFAGVILIVSGFFGVIQGLAALIGPDTYYAVGGGSLLLFDVQGWGWWTLIIGVLMVLTGAALFTGQTWARVVAIILAVISALVQMFLLPAQPWWAVLVIAIDVLIIYALTAHGRELRAAN